MDRNLIVIVTDSTGNQPSRRVPVRSAYPYEGIVQRLIRPWKYDGALALTRWFAEALCVTLTPSEWAGVDAIVPVPTSAERLKMRGYHHTLLLAQELGRMVDKPVEQWLVRDSGAETQTAKSAKQRQLVMDAEMRVPANTKNPYSGRRVLLLDDVVTTGATLHGCAAKLLSAGVGAVGCIVIAHVD